MVREVTKKLSIQHKHKAFEFDTEDLLMLNIGQKDFLEDLILQLDLQARDRQERERKMS